MGNPCTAVAPDLASETAATTIRMNTREILEWHSLSTQAWLRLGKQRAASRFNRLLALQAVARSWKYREVDGFLNMDKCGNR